MRNRCVRNPLLLGVIATVALGSSLPASGSIAARTGAVLERFASARLPVLGSGQRTIQALRPATLRGHPPRTRLSPDAHPWQLLATIPGAVIHDISFPTSATGYAAAELGQVWKTTDSGRTWTEVMNLGFPYYWYGVDALTPNDVVVSGFDDSNFTGILRWSHDGGTTWSDDVVITTDGWSNRVRFVGTQNGLVVGELSLDSANEVQYTTNGGGAAGDWTTVTPDPNGGWFGSDFTFRPDLSAYISGITEGFSRDGGATWGAVGPPSIRCSTERSSS